jgi:hypothetical protein
MGTCRPMRWSAMCGMSGMDRWMDGWVLCDDEEEEMMMIMYHVLYHALLFPF